jgi:hypothetical protein
VPLSTEAKKARFFLLATMARSTKSLRMIFEQVYAPQTKILEDRTNISEGIFEALFKGVSTRLGLRVVEKCFETAF